MGACPETPQFYYDLGEGVLVVGDAAHQDALERGVNPADMPSLKEVLLQPDAFDLPDTTPLNAKDWEPEQFVALTSWLGHSVLQHEPLKSRHFRTLYKLGIGPSYKLIENRLSYSWLYKEAGLPNVYKRGVYDYWDIDRFTDHVCEIAKRTPKTVSIRRELDTIAQAGEGPSYKAIKRRIKGGLKWLLARGGFYDFNDSTEDDYYDWGVDFMIANNGRPITTEALNLLSPKRRGPSYSAIRHNWWGGVEVFREQVEARYHETVESVSARNQAQLQFITEALGTGDIPVEVIVGCSTEAEIRHAAAKYMLLRKYSPVLTPSRFMDVSKGTTKRVVSTIIEDSEGVITAGDIEETALLMGIFDDLWPSKANKYLKI